MLRLLSAVVFGAAAIGVPLFVVGATMSTRTEGLVVLGTTAGLFAAVVAVGVTVDRRLRRPSHRGGDGTQR